MKLNEWIYFWECALGSKHTTYNIVNIVHIFSAFKCMYDNWVNFIVFSISLGGNNAVTCTGTFPN